MILISNKPRFQSPAGRAGGEQRTHGESAAPEDLVCARPSGRGRGGGELSVQFDVLIAFEPHKKHVEPLRKELIEIKRVSMQTNKYSFAAWSRRYAARMQRCTSELDLAMLPISYRLAVCAKRARQSRQTRRQRRLPLRSPRTLATC